MAYSDRFVLIQVIHRMFFLPHLTVIYFLFASSCTLKKWCNATTTTITTTTTSNTSTINNSHYHGNTDDNKEKDNK